MKKTALIKTSLREIRQSTTRFLSIMGIIFLGVMVFVGLKATGPDMIKTANNYYQKEQLPDARIISTMGLEKKDLTTLQSLKDVETVVPRYTIDATIGPQNNAVKLFGYRKNQAGSVNYQVVDGRLPKQTNEIALDTLAKTRYDYKMGDKITLNDAAIKEKGLTQTHFTVVGFINSPEYIDNTSRGTTTVGSGTLNFFGVVSEKAFDSQRYPELLISFRSLKHQNTYSPDYEKKREQALNQVKEALKNRPEEQVAALRDSAQPDINQGRQALETGKQALAQLEQQPGIPAEMLEKQKDELAKQEQLLAEKETELANLKAPTYYYFTREDNPGFSEYQDNADRISSLATLFPLFFFLIAALVSLTTMTRMVEEKRMEIGSLKALGYRNREIASIFITYATVASLTGALLGLAVGYYLFPKIIFDAYGQMYNIPDLVTPWYLNYSLWGIIVALACTVGAALVTLRIDLLSTPATLLRPKAPKAGQRILLERIRPLWQRMSFIQKVTARNLFRYKRRMLMTVIGIAGCMGLLIVGFGLRDSIVDVATIQFNKIWHYQAVVTFKEQTTAEETKEYQETLRKLDGLNKTIPLYSEIFKTKGKGAPTQNITLYVPQDPSKMAEFQLFNDRVTGEKYSLNDDGVIINEKLAKLFGYKVGDQLNLENSDNQTYHVKIAAIAENYTGHFVYMTPKLYQTMTKQKPEYNTEFLLFDKKLSSKQETSIGEVLTKQPKVLNITFLTAMKGSFDDMLKSLDIVIWVLIAVSGSLALIVLYNLTNINVSEGIRELSTIKVLGFYDREVTTYVYRENIILTFIGIIVGCFFGKILHQYILATVEVDLIMFSPIIHWPSYLYSAVITMCFTLFVMVIMHRKLKKINMIEALKSNE